MIKTFETLGLSKSESEVLDILCKSETTSSTKIVKLVSLSASNVYLALEKLINRGLISKIQINSRPVYRTNGKEMFNSLKSDMKISYEDKLSTLKEFEKEFDRISIKTSSNPSAEIFIGLKNLRTAHARLFDEKQSGEFIFFYDHTEVTGPIIHDFFSKMDVNNYYKSIPTRALFSKNYETIFKSRNNAKFKAKFTNIPIPSSINIYGTKVLMISWSDNPIAFLISSSEISNNFKGLFEKIWILSK